MKLNLNTFYSCYKSHTIGNVIHHIDYHRMSIYSARAAQPKATCTFSLVPITDALWKIDSGPNCFQLMMDFRDRTLRTRAHEHMNIKTQAINPSNDDTFVILQSACVVSRC
jgi:hypothetical protein